MPNYLRVSGCWEIGADDGCQRHNSWHFNFWRYWMMIPCCHCDVEFLNDNERCWYSSRQRRCWSGALQGCIGPWLGEGGVRLGLDSGCVGGLFGRCGFGLGFRGLGHTLVKNREWDCVTLVLGMTSDRDTGLSSRCTVLGHGQHLPGLIWGFSSQLGQSWCMGAGATDLIYELYRQGACRCSEVWGICMSSYCRCCGDQHHERHDNGDDFLWNSFNYIDANSQKSFAF